MKYTIKDFHKQFKTDADCLEFVYRMRWPEGAVCEECGKQDRFHAVTDRKSYACQCGHQISPTAGTIFHKSPTPLKSWFFAMFLMTASKNGVAAKELERQLGVTYKCAWRMAHQIRQLMKQNRNVLKGVIEADETYWGGKRPGKRGRGAAGKTPIIGVMERGGDVVAKTAENVKAKTLMPHILNNVEPGSTIHTDELPSYAKLPNFGFTHETVNHGRKEFVRAEVHTNSIEGFWSQLKRSIHGTFHHVSAKHLQKYVNEFAYRYNRRKSELPMFLHLVAAMGERQLQEV